MSKTAKLKYLFSAVLVGFPAFTFAFSLFQEGTTFKDVIMEVLGIIDLLIPIMTGVAFIIFFWGLSKFILNSGNEAELTKGKSYMFWGILAIFVLLTVRTIVGLIAWDLGIGDTSAIPVIPHADESSNSGIMLPGSTPGDTFNGR